MAIPAIPFNFNIQQGNLQVLLTWNNISGATSYDIQRSTDGVTFTPLATPSVNEYFDTSVLLNTKYYYKVASVNGSGTSGYTSAESIIATLPGKMCLGELRLRSQQKADRVNSNFVTMTEWNYFINQAYAELYDLLITVYEDYYIAPRLSFTTDSSQQYDLPNGQNYDEAPAIYKLYGVDLGLDNSSNAWVTLKKYDFISRNRYVYPQLTSTYLGVFNLRYRLLGDKISFIPTPSSGQVVGLWYYPRLTMMLADTDVMDGISGWEQYIICRSAKYALDKEESNTDKIDQEIGYLKSRIEGSAQNRDVGQGDTISQVRTWSERWGTGGGGYDGSFGGY